jgi:hypothetical protein
VPQVRLAGGGRVIRAAWVRAPLNVRKAVAYLREIGVELVPAQVRGWYEQEAASRRDRRRVRWCEGFRCDVCGATWTREGKARARRMPRCPVCRRQGPATSETWWTEWYERGDGTRVEVR